MPEPHRASLTMDFETAFDLLSNDCRRAVVAVLAETDAVTRDQLTTRLLARGVGPDGTDSQRNRRRLRIALHHNHLPRMADVGVVKYDDETVAPTPKLDDLADHLDRSGRADAVLGRRQAANDSRS